MYKSYEFIKVVGEELNSKVTNDLLDDSLVGGDSEEEGWASAKQMRFANDEPGLLEGGDLITAPWEEDELGTRAQVISGLNAQETIGTLVWLEVSSQSCI